MFQMMYSPIAFITFEATYSESAMYSESGCVPFDSREFAIDLFDFMLTWDNYIFHDRFFGYVCEGATAVYKIAFDYMVRFLGIRDALW